MLKKFLNREKGITGLETAIILIAFVVVAAVFAYTTWLVLNPEGPGSSVFRT